MTNPSEFERTKPVETMKKINKLLKRIEELSITANSREEQNSYSELYEMVVVLKETFKKGE